MLRLWRRLIPLGYCPQTVSCFGLLSILPVSLATQTNLRQLRVARGQLDMLPDVVEAGISHQQFILELPVGYLEAL